MNATRFGSGFPAQDSGVSGESEPKGGDFLNDGNRGSGRPGFGPAPGNGYHIRLNLYEMVMIIFKSHGLLIWSSEKY